MIYQIATTYEQSERLLNCGVSLESADLARYIYDSRSIMEWDWSTGSYGGTFASWSLSSMLNLLPKEIEIDGYKYRISIYFVNPDEPVIGNQWCLYYKPKKYNERSPRIDDVTMYAHDLIECVVLMVKWLKDNGYSLNNIGQ